MNTPASETPEDVFPGRLIYPTNEAQINPNFSEGSTQPNEMSTRMWWARDPGETASVN